MTEKRFTSKVVNWWHNIDEVRVVFDKGEWIDADNCAKLLNALYKENEQLKEQNRQLRLKNGRLTHNLFWANKKIKEELE